MELDDWRGDYSPSSTDAREVLRQVEIEGVEELDGRVRRVDDDVARHVEERLGVVEEDLHARADEVVRGGLRVVGRNGQHADDDVLLADDLGELRVVADLDVADAAADLLGVGVENGGDVDPVLGEDRRAADRLAEAPRADERDVVLALGAEDL